ncbi:MAG: putative metalloprotease CJM1_0395 family protein, partial [Lentisphaerota bacterium]
MNPLVPISEEDQPKQELSRLELFYQGKLDAQAEERKADKVKEAAETDNKDEEKASQEESESQQRSDTLLLNGTLKNEASPIYSRTQLLSQAAQTPGPQDASELQQDASGLDASDRELLQRLRARDAEVRQHEMRHVAALGHYAGAVQFHYQIGPDGRAYAVGGSTEVQASGPSDPASSAARARQVRQAAMAGGDPSNADLSAAVSATQSEQAA